MTGRSSCDHVLAWAIEQPWAITRPMLAVVAHVLGRRLAGTDLDPTALLAARAEAAQRPAVPAPGNGVAVMALHGVLAPRMNMLSEVSGGATFEQATAHLATLAADPSVSTIVLDWDSPGGSVAGATEFAHGVLQARQSKRVISVANHQMCSAAYWAGACASEVVASPSALVGSIGVYCVHEDLTQYLAKEGIALTPISAGKYKVDGGPWEPLSESARARLQAVVDSAMAMFVADVAAGRGVSPETVRTGMGEGATLTATEARAAGLIDRVETLDTVIARAVTAPPLAARRSLSADNLQLGRALVGLGIVH